MISFSSSVNSNPELPSSLDNLLDLPCTSESSCELDRWLNYLSLEFEGVER